MTTTSPELHTLRVALAMERVVGHAVFAAEMEHHLAGREDLEVKGVPVTFHDESGWIERLPLVPPSLRAAWRARRQVMMHLGPWQPDVVFWNTQKPACLCLDLLRKCPSVISLDVTPKQYDGEIAQTSLDLLSRQSIGLIGVSSSWLTGSSHGRIGRETH
jgi:hypothetical protein